MTKNLDKDGLSSIVDNYQLFYIDLWGVVHNGVSLHEKAINVLKENGFIGACSTFWRTTQKKKDQYLLNRIMITQDDDIRNFEKKLSGHYDYLYFVHKFKALCNRIFNGRGIF